MRWWMIVTASHYLPLSSFWLLALSLGNYCPSPNLPSAFVCLPLGSKVSSIMCCKASQASWKNFTRMLLPVSFLITQFSFLFDGSYVAPYRYKSFPAHVPARACARAMAHPPWCNKERLWFVTWYARGGREETRKRLLTFASFCLSFSFHLLPVIPALMI